MRDVDLKTVGLGAGAALAIILPVVLLVRIISHGDPQPIEALVPLALLVGFGVAGALCARRSPERPLLHAALAALATWVVSLALTIARAGVDLARVLTLVLLVQITVALAVGVAALTARRMREPGGAT